MTHQVIYSSCGGGHVTTTSCLWKIESHSRMNGTRIEHRNCLVSPHWHFISCHLRLSATALTQLNIVGFKQSTASWSCVLVASCAAYELAALVMVERRTLRDKSSTVAIFSLPPLSNFWASEHILPMSISIISFVIRVPIIRGISPLCDNLVKK